MAKDSARLERNMENVTNMDDILKQPLIQATESSQTDSMDFSGYGNFSAAEIKERHNKSPSQVAVNLGATRPMKETAKVAFDEASGDVPTSILLNNHSRPRPILHAAFDSQKARSSTDGLPTGQGEDLSEHGSARPEN
jgi:hypothetical protein